MRELDFHEFIQKRQEEHEDRYDALDERYKTDYKEFVIENFELKSLEEWTSAHGMTCRKRSYSYRFTPTGIGTGVTVECECGALENITDYESW